MLLIPDLYNAVFGLIPGFSIPQPPPISQIQEMISGSGLNIPPAKEHTSRQYYDRIGAPVAQSVFGLEAFYSITMGGESLKYFEPNGELKTKVFEQLTLPLSLLVDQDTSQVRVDTPINGGYGTVKELYSLSDWQFRIRGLLIDEGTPGRSALEIKHKLIALRQFVDAIPISGLLFDELGVDRVCIDSLSFRQLEGQPWVIGFDMMLESDYSLELEIKSGNKLNRV